MRGKFIVFEGLDHCGKSTQVQKIADYFGSLGKECKIISYPERSTPIGVMINEFLKSKSNLTDEAIHLLFAANRWEKNEEVKQLLEAGVNIVSDRYAYSGVAFTSAKDYDLEWCKNADRSLIKPDKVIFLDIPVSEISKRNGFGEERYEKIDFQIKVKEKFDKMAKVEGDWMIVDATNSIDGITNQIISELKNLEVKEKIDLLWV